MSTSYLIPFATLVLAILAAPLHAEEPGPAEKNLAIEKTRGSDLVIHPINHSALRFEFKGKQYYVDPAGEGA